MLIKLVMGDPSNDGHGISETVILSTEYTVKQIQDFVRSAERALGLKMEDIAHEYEEPYISSEHREALMLAGVVGPEDFEAWEGNFWVTSADYLHIYLSLAEMGNGGKPVGEVLEVEQIDIGGYGLYQH